MNARVGLRMIDLLDARIGRLDGIEELGETDGGLAIAGAAIPRRLPARRELGKCLEQRSGIRRSGARVQLRCV